MIRRAHILPTGDELVNGWVADTSSTAIASVLRSVFPWCDIQCLPPVRDSETRIVAQIDRSLATGIDLLVVSGGSGGGHRHLPELAMDLTHSALTGRFPEAAHRDIYGSSGHLWCRVVAAEYDGALILSVPGPHVGAVSAMEGAVRALVSDRRDLADLAEALVQGVLQSYPPDAVEITNWC